MFRSWRQKLREFKVILSFHSRFTARLGYMRPYVKQTNEQTNQDIHIRKLGQLLLDSLKSYTLGFRKQIFRDISGKWNLNKCDVRSQMDIWVLKYVKVTWAHEAQRDRNSWLVLMCHRNVLQGLTCLHRGWGQTSEPYVDTLPRASLGDTEMTGNAVRNFLVPLPFLKLQRADQKDLHSCLWHPKISQIWF